MAWPPPAPGTWVIDLDGVVWLGGQPIEGAAQGIAVLRDAGVRVVFVTNNASPTMAQLLARLDRAGIPAQDDDVLSSAQAAASMVHPGGRVLVEGEDGLREALRARRVEVVEEGPIDAVMVSRTERFDYRALDRASRLVREGSRLIGTSEDPTHPTPEGLVPGSGALVAAVATAAGVVAEVAGKPHPAMVELIGDRLGEVSVVVGDRPSTDGVLAERLGARYALVLSGVTSPSAAPADPSPDVVAADLSALVQTLPCSWEVRPLP